MTMYQRRVTRDDKTMNIRKATSEQSVAIETDVEAFESQPKAPKHICTQRNSNERQSKCMKRMKEQK